MGKIGGKGTQSYRAHGAESCPRPLVLKAGVRARGPKLPREGGHYLCPDSGSRRSKQR